MNNYLRLLTRATFPDLKVMAAIWLAAVLALVWGQSGPDVIAIPESTPQVTSDERPAVDVTRNLAGEGCVYAVTIDGDVYQADGPCPVNR